MDLSIIIVSWNTREYLRNCIQSIIENTKNISYEIIVVDNNSGDGTKELIKNTFPKIMFEENKENLGFVKGNNIGINLSKGEFILLLNPDTIILDGALDKLVEFIKQNPEAGAVSSRMWLTEKKNFELPILPPYNPVFTLCFTVSFGRFFPFLKKYWEKNWEIWSTRKEFYEVDGIVGACFLLKKSLILKLGLLNENLFMYFEDSDLSRKIKKKGLKLFIVGTSEIVHLYNKSGEKNPKKEEIALNSMKKYYTKVYGSWVLVFLFIGNYCLKIIDKFYKKIYPYLSHLNEVYLTKENPKLTWKPVNGAFNYHLDISLDHVFVGVAGTVVCGTSYDFSAFITESTEGNSYNYRVIPRFSMGKIGKPQYGIIRLPKFQPEEITKT